MSDSGKNPEASLVEPNAVNKPQFHSEQITQEGQTMKRERSLTTAQLFQEPTLNIGLK